MGAVYIGMIVYLLSFHTVEDTTNQTIQETHEYVVEWIEDGNILLSNQNTQDTRYVPFPEYAKYSVDLHAGSQVLLYVDNTNTIVDIKEVN